MAKAITKKEKFQAMVSYIKGESITLSKAELIECLEHEIEQLNKKRSSSSNSKKNAETERITTMIYNELVEMEKPVTITEFIKLTGNRELAEFSNQRLSAFMKKLVDSGRVERFTDKKKSYFKVTE